MNSATMHRHTLDLLNNLRAGTRFALFRQLGQHEFLFTLTQIGLFLAFEFTVLLVYDYVTAGPQPVFNVYGLTESGTSYLLFFTSAFVIARAFNDTAAARKLVLVLLTVSPLITGFYLLTVALTYDDAGLSWAVWCLTAAWTCAVAARAIRLFFVPSRAAVGGATMLFATLNYGSILVLPNQPLWFSSDTSDYVQRPRINIEDTYYRQWPLLESVRVAPGRPGVTDLYFVGFGGYAPQDVFRKEVRYAKSVFDSDYDTAGRSVALINSRTTLDTTPLATANNLRLVLEDIGNKMNREEDMLFLFMTSHGSKNAELAVDFWPLEPNDLNAEQLARMLDESGIKWRVIVISACYSGSFIDPLRSETTLLMTASHKDKQSFGCSNARDFTYFGEAYFGDALRRQRSWIAAFEYARDTIRQREIAEKKKPSQPQIFVGSRIEEKLAAYQATNDR